MYNSCTLWNHMQTPGQGKISSRGSSVIPALSPRKYSICKSSLWALPAPPHTSNVQVETLNEAENEPKNKKLKKKKCSNDKLCLMIAPPIGRQMAERNRTKVFACINSLTLLFKSISVNKNNSYNSVDIKI